MCWQACAKTCEFIYSQRKFIQESMDGKNLESVLTEFGTRIHRQVFEHLQQFQYTSIGKQCLFHARFVSRLTFSRFMLFLARRTRLTRSYCKRHTLIMATELCVHCRVFFLGGMVAICDISEYRSCIKEFKVIKNIRTVVLACWLFSPHLFSLLKWNRMNRGQFNYPVSERTQWQLVLNFDALILGHYSVPSLPHLIEWMF